MNSDLIQQAFLKEIERLRKLPKRIEPSDIVQIARSTGMSVSETLLRINDYSDFNRDFNRRRGSQSSEALSIFISAMCKPDSRILEYTTEFSLRTATLFDEPRRPKITYIAPEYLHNTLQFILSERDTQLLQSQTELTNDAPFDTIVCAPHLGIKPNREDESDGFGGETVIALAPHLAKPGILYWITARGVLFNEQVKKTLTKLKSLGVEPSAIIEIPALCFANTIIDGVLIILSSKPFTKKFVGILRDNEAAKPMAADFVAGPSRKPGPSWDWLDRENQDTFTDIERRKDIKGLTPRGRHEKTAIRALTINGLIEKADQQLQGIEDATGFLFVPKYPGSLVTTKIEDQTVKPKDVFRISIDVAKANIRFLARLLNSPYGRQLRSQIAGGVGFRHMLSDKDLLSLELPLPDIDTQNCIVRIDGDIALLEADFLEMRNVLDQNWSNLSEVIEKVDELKVVLDIERKISDWWRELPYPLATIYRRYQVSKAPKERFDTLLHFFEMSAIYLAALGASHSRMMRKDWQDVFAKWLHPTDAAGIERTDIGFWIGLAAASLKDANRIASDKELRDNAIEVAGPDLVHVATLIGQLGKTTKVLNIARQYRNKWKGHGGHMKDSDALRLDEELQQQIRELYELTASTFRRLLLVRPGSLEYTDDGFKYQVEVLSGSDPTFKTESINLNRPVKSNALAFWMHDTRTMCPALPFFRLGAPQQPRETSFYVFNRVEDDKLRWISYQETNQQEFFTSDDELLTLISLGKVSQ